jgi:GNAT superfamily N-acetyltransferase
LDRISRTSAEAPPDPSGPEQVARQNKMKRLYRSLAHNYAEGGIPLLFAKAFGVLQTRLWSNAEWLVYEQNPLTPPSDAAFKTQHRSLNFDELVALKYEKALAFPEDILQRFARGDVCHGFFHSSDLVTLGWSGSHYMELNIGETIDCPGAWGLFDFITIPAFQSRGFYTDALRQLALLAHDQGFNALWIAVHPANIPSRKGIERAGFRLARKITKRRILGIAMRREQPLHHPPA